MSYWFRMNFKEIEEKDLFDYALSVADACVDNAKEILKENMYYIPSVRFGGRPDFRDKEYFAWAEVDQKWLYQLFAIKFVYWKEKKILGIIGTLPKEIEEQLTTIEFQNSTDQDYDYEYWSGISYFENVVNRIRDYELADILEALKREYEDEYAEDEIVDQDYHRRSLIYKEIFRELELDAWLYDNPGDFKKFSIEGITSQEKQCDIYTELKCLLHSVNEP